VRKSLAECKTQDFSSCSFVVLFSLDFGQLSSEGGWHPREIPCSTGTTVCRPRDALVSLEAAACSFGITQVLYSSLPIPISFLCSQILRSSGLCPAPAHPVPLTSFPGATAASQHLCQEQPKALSTGIYPPKFRVSLLPRAAVWPIPIPDSPTTQQDTSCWCRCSRRRLDTPCDG